VNLQYISMVLCINFLIVLLSLIGPIAYTMKMQTGIIISFCVIVANIFGERKKLN